MLFTSAITTLLLASSAAALPPHHVGVTSVNGTAAHLETRGSLTNITEAVVPRSLNFTGKPILPRSWNSTVFPRLALDKNTTEGIFDKRDLPVVEGVAAPSGIIKRDASPTGYVKRSYGTGTPFQA